MNKCLEALILGFLVAMAVARAEALDPKVHEFAPPVKVGPSDPDQAISEIDAYRRQSRYLLLWSDAELQARFEQILSTPEGIQRLREKTLKEPSFLMLAREDQFERVFGAPRERGTPSKHSNAMLWTFEHAGKRVYVRFRNGRAFSIGMGQDLPYWLSGEVPPNDKRNLDIQSCHIERYSRVIDIPRPFENAGLLGVSAKAGDAWGENSPAVELVKQGACRYGANAMFFESTLKDKFRNDRMFRIIRYVRSETEK